MLARVKRAMAITANLNCLTFNDADEVRGVVFSRTDHGVVLRELVRLISFSFLRLDHYALHYPPQRLRASQSIIIRKLRRFLDTQAG
jgi:hypothetical protein